jgi:uncharacterized membrane protein
VSFAGWLVARTITSEIAPPGHPLSSRALTFFYVDASWLLLAAAVALWTRGAPTLRQAWWSAAALSAITSAEMMVGASQRYLSGASRAWDLANYVQPMWRAAHGLSMTSAAYVDRPVWADHGAFAMFLMAPFTRLSEPAALGMFALQSLLAGASVLTMFGLSRALGLPTYAGLGAAAVLASSRALAHAARFDFHPECALPVLLLGLAWTHERRRTIPALVLTILAVSLRDVAALTVALLWVYWALRERSRSALIVAAGCALVAALDMVWLPRWTGWQSYVALHGSVPVDGGLAAETTALRALSTFGIGWLHPIAWFAGAPWVVAAGLSPKLLVKGIDFQYGFLFVPVAALGALHALRQLEVRAPRQLGWACVLWVATATAVNAPAPASVTQTLVASARMSAVHEQLAALVSREGSVAADACAAPYVMDRTDLTLLCRLDGTLLQKTGLERWEEPVTSALSSEHIVVREGCSANGACVNEQLRRAQHEGGFRVAGRAGPFVVLRR